MTNVQTEWTRWTMQVEEAHSTCLAAVVATPARSTQRRGGAGASGRPAPLMSPGVLNEMVKLPGLFGGGAPSLLTSPPPATPPARAGAPPGKARQRAEGGKQVSEGGKAPQSLKPSQTELQPAPSPLPMESPSVAAKVLDPLQLPKVDDATIKLAQRIHSGEAKDSEGGTVAAAISSCCGVLLPDEVFDWGGCCGEPALVGAFVDLARSTNALEKVVPELAKASKELRAAQDAVTEKKTQVKDLTASASAAQSVVTFKVAAFSAAAKEVADRPQSRVAEQEAPVGAGAAGTSTLISPEVLAATGYDSIAELQELTPDSKKELKEAVRGMLNGKQIVELSKLLREH